jgi:hypothetical protein
LKLAQTLGREATEGYASVIPTVAKVICMCHVCGGLVVDSNVECDEREDR